MVSDKEYEVLKDIEIGDKKYIVGEKVSLSDEDAKPFIESESIQEAKDDAGGDE